MGEKILQAFIVAVGVVAVGQFFKGAWDDAKEQAEAAANPPYRWTDKNRWE